MPTNIKVEKNIPLPVGGTRLGESKYPFAGMEVGDSFSIPYISSNHEKAVRAAASYQGKQRGMKFTVRVVEEDTLRVWRIE